MQFESGPWTRIARYFFFVLGWHARGLAQRTAASSSAIKVVLAAAGCVVAAAVAVVLDLQPVPGVALALNIAAVTFGLLFSAWISPAIGSVVRRCALEPPVPALRCSNMQKLRRATAARRPAPSRPRG